MAQFVRTQINNNDIQNVLNHTIQVSQVVYHGRHPPSTIEINWDNESNRVVVQEYGYWFYLNCPDIDHLTIYQVLCGLGYGNEQAVVTWTEDGYADGVLNSNVSTKLSKIRY